MIPDYELKRIKEVFTDRDRGIAFLSETPDLWVPALIRRLEAAERFCKAVEAHEEICASCKAAGALWRKEGCGIREVYVVSEK